MDWLSSTFAGCLLGKAVGDAAGFIVEGHPPELCREYVDSYLRDQRVLDLSRGPFSFGQYSDDTQLARELAISLVHSAGFDPEDYAGRIARQFSETLIVGRGAATEAAAFRLADGVHWRDSGTPAPSAGNGSAMRVAPVALVYAHDSELLKNVAHTQSYITHQDRRCSAGSIAVAGAIAYLIGRTGKAVVLPLMWSHVAALVADWDLEFSEAIRLLGRRTGEAPEAVLPWIQSIGLAPDAKSDWEGISPFVLPSVLWSLYCFSRTRNYWDAVCLAISAGGDTDTTAAMTGAIAGARYGVEGIPDNVMTLVNDRGGWGTWELESLAGDLVSLHEQLKGRLQ